MRLRDEIYQTLTTKTKNQLDKTNKMFFKMAGLDTIREKMIIVKCIYFTPVELLSR